MNGYSKIIEKYNTIDGKIYQGDAIDVLKSLPSESVNCCVTSPPYWNQRDYGVIEWSGGDPNCDHIGKYIKRSGSYGGDKQARNKGSLFMSMGDCKCGAVRVDQQIGHESTVNKYIQKMVEVFEEVQRVLCRDATLWLNLGDTYRKKRLCGVPWRVALALNQAGWFLRQDIIWNKPNAMPDGIADRCTMAHEYLFLLSKSKQYYFDAETISKAMNRHKRSVWHVGNANRKYLHFATFPSKLIEPCILAGCPVGGVVLDPFFGSGTVGLVAYEHGRRFMGIDLSDDYLEKIAIPRIKYKTQQRRLFD